MTFATQRWRYGSADTALRDRLDAFYVVGRQLELESAAVVSLEVLSQLEQAADANHGDRHQ